MVVIHRDTVKLSVKLWGHKTSISLDKEFLDALRDIAAERGVTVARIVREVDLARSPADRSRSGKPAHPLSHAVRLYILQYYRTKSIANKQ